MSTLPSLTDTESKLIEAVANGSLLDLTVVPPALATDEEDASTVQHMISAEIVIALCIQQYPDWTVHPKGVRIKGGKITGCLDFEGMSLKTPLVLLDCEIEEKIILTDADAVVLRFSGSKVPGIQAERLSLKGTLYINRGFTCNGEILLRDATIKGSIFGEGARLNNPSGRSFDGVRLTIGGTIQFNEGFCSFGEISLMDARIEGSFICAGATFENPGKLALRSPRVVIRGVVFFNEGFKAKGEIRLILSQVAGLNCEGGIFDNQSGISIAANSLVVKGSVSLSNNFVSKGIISFSFASIGGTLNCTNARFENPDKNAFEGYEMKTVSTVRFKSNNCEGRFMLNGASIGGELIFWGGNFDKPCNGITLEAARIAVKQNIVFSNGFKATGSLLLGGAEVGGSLHCNGITLVREFSTTLDASGIVVKGGVRITNKFSAQGDIRFDSARIGADFQMLDSNLSGTFKAGYLTTGSFFRIVDSSFNGELYIPNAEIGADLFIVRTTITATDSRVALNAPSVITKGNVRLIDRFTAKGQLNFSSARIGNDFDCTGTVLEIYPSYEQEPDENFRLFDASLLNIKGTLFWRNITIFPRGIVNLSGARMDRLIDDVDSWPEKERLMIESIAFSSLLNSTLSAEQRLEWLRRQRSYSPEPYEQVVKALRLNGHDADARMIARAKKNDLRHFGKLDRFSKFWNWFLDFTIGHGYQVWRVIVIALIFITLGNIVFALADHAGAMAMIKDKGSNYPEFQPLIFSIDVFLPIVDLRQETYWLPIAPCKYGFIFRAYMWVHIVIGWLLTTVAVAGLTGIVKRD